MTFEPACDDLEWPWRRSLELAYDSLRSGTLAVGSVLTDAFGVIIAEGRNRAYDQPGGSEALQGTPLAHAEMNVLAAVRTGRDLAGCTLWTTVEPCSMCRAAAHFTGLRHVRLLAPDPWAIAAGLSGQQDHAEGLTLEGPAGDVWQIVADVLFLISVAIPGGEDHPTVVANARHEPEATQLALASREVDLRLDLPEQLAAMWPGLIHATEARTVRLSSRR